MPTSLSTLTLPGGALEDRLECHGGAIMSEHSDVVEEIERLHAFFENWFSGVDGARIDEFSECLDEEFYIVSPDGTISDKATVVGIVDGLQDSGRIEIRIENVIVRRSDRSGICIATYEEHQNRPERTETLISTVGLLADLSAPGGYRWLFVHETIAKA